MPGPTIELVLYAARPGVSDSEMIAAVEETSALLQEFPGYLERELAYSAEAKLWVDIVHWADRDSALAAAGSFGSHPAAQRLMATIDFTRLTLHHFDSKLIDRALLLAGR
jgi:hypothetical protein